MLNYCRTQARKCAIGAKRLRRNVYLEIQKNPIAIGGLGLGGTGFGYYYKNKNDTITRDEIQQQKSLKERKIKAIEDGNCIRREKNKQAKEIAKEQQEIAKEQIELTKEKIVLKKQKEARL